MKLIKRTFQFLLLFALLSATACQDKYPDLEDGLYTEIITNKGTMILKLEYHKAPITVANFVSLAEGTNKFVDSIYAGKKFFNGLTFHRVMDNFMIQGGDPLGNGTGSAGYKFDNEISPDLKHDKAGVLSMANSGGTNTNGSQFFITDVPYPALDGKYSVFGHLVKGEDVLHAIADVKVAQPGNKPVEPVIMNEVNIIRKGKDAKAFDAPKVFAEGLAKAEKAEKERVVKMEAEQKMKKEKAEAAKEEFLKNNENLKGEIEKSPTGLAMIFTKKGNGVKPKSTDKVLIDYAGYFENGDLFDTSLKEVAKKNGTYDEARDKQGGYKPFPMIYNETATLVAGFREAMLKMNVGDKARVFIPSYLGYGARGYGPVPPDANLVFDLEIVDIVK